MTLTKREIPPPPPPEMFGASDQGHPAFEIFRLIVLVVFIGMVVCWIWAMYNEETKRNTFIAKCIEFRTYDRCSLLYQYGRLDLVDQHQ